MNVFKINRGLEANLPAVLTNGCCYFCTDTTNFYIDYEDKNGVLTRSKLSSKYADTLRYTEDGNFVEINPTDIITKNNYETIISVASTDKNGLMSSADKIKLNNLPEDISASLANEFISAKGGSYSLDTTLELSLNNIPNVISGIYDNPIFRISADGLKYSKSDTQSYDFESYFSPIALVLNRSYSEGGNATASCFLPNIWQLLDDETDGDHKKFYVRPNSFQWRRYNGGWKNHYISAELDKLKIYNDQKLISFENSKLENIASPTADNDAATKKYVDDKIPVEATTTNSGLLSAEDKIKLDGIAQNANNYTLPVATADALGGVKPIVKTDNMTKEVGVDADGKLYVDEHTMIVAFTNSNSGLVSDKTYAEIKEAYESGKRVCATCSLSGYNMLLQLSSFEKKSDIDVVLFTGVGGSSRVILIVYSNDNHVNLATQNFVSDYQGTENADKILGINSSGYVTVIDKPTFTIDTTLTKSGQAADAKTVGDTFISNSANLMVEIDKKANSSDIPDISGKVDKLQGTDNAGKLLSVGNDGNVTTLSADNFLSSSGGEYTTNGVYKFIKASTGNYVNIDSNTSSMGIYVEDTSNAMGRSVGMTDYGFYIMSRDSQDGSMQLFKNKLTIAVLGDSRHEINIGINDAHNTYISSYTKKLYFEESVLKNIGAPVDSTDAVTKKYVDEKFASVTIKTWTAADMT